MKTSIKGKIALAVSEGIVDTPYLDSVGVWTVGIGVTKGAGLIDPEKNKGKTFTIPELMEMFEKALEKYERTVSTLVKVPVTQNEFDAMVHFCYNIGQAGFQRSNLLKNLNAGNKAVAFGSGFHGWMKPASLKSRRDKERNMALRGAYGSSVAPLYGVNSSYKPKVKGVVNLTEAHFKKTSSPSTTSPQSTFSLWDLLKKLFGG